MKYLRRLLDLLCWLVVAFFLYAFATRRPHGSLYVLGAAAYYLLSVAYGVYARKRKRARFSVSLNRYGWPTSKAETRSLVAMYILIANAGALVAGEYFGWAKLAWWADFLEFPTVVAWLILMVLATAEAASSRDQTVSKSEIPYD